MERCSKYWVKKVVEWYYLKRSISGTILWNFTKTNFSVRVFKLLYQHSSGRFCILSEWFFKEQKQWPEAFCKKNFFKRFQNSKENNVPESSFKVAECFKKEALAQVFLCKFYKIFKNCFVEAIFCRTSINVCFQHS